MNSSKKYILIIICFLSGCKKEAPKIEIWGDNEHGWSMEAKKTTGETLFRVSDDAKDTTAFKIMAEKWANKN